MKKEEDAKAPDEEGKAKPEPSAEEAKAAEEAAKKREASRPAVGDQVVVYSTHEGRRGQCIKIAEFGFVRSLPVANHQGRIDYTGANYTIDFPNSNSRVKHTIDEITVIRKGAQQPRRRQQAARVAV